MSDKQEDAPRRRYPRFYEKIVPIALVLIVTAMIILVLVIFGVASGLFLGG
jgi:hypothetical protein